MPGRTVEPRELSPTSGTSILTISAPRSAISMYGTVPACAVEQATTFTPWSGPCGSVMASDLLSGPRIWLYSFPLEKRLGWGTASPSIRPIGAGCSRIAECNELKRSHEICSRAAVSVECESTFDNPRQKNLPDDPELATACSR